MRAGPLALPHILEKLEHLFLYKGKKTSSLASVNH